ncbi:prion-like-(Q/N-rich) domain-bearing protein 25 isoform X1 [Anastrepha obliqua]|uniref:prion-like-(Q/N-rich) domain-bearing protein 25 isoform X1 n=2 Tax=Anastrepha obliqua TaxID=95512 RepID=UPI002408F86C|nr:prion-like-(Q/N-rich) domain-bearing protein 25 isoform X1 [Anastrepha obliqua]
MTPTSYTRGVVVLLSLGIIAVTDAAIWPCSSSSDCTAVKSTCNTETANCECDSFDYVLASNLTECLKTSLIGDQCEDTVQCNLMPSGASCKSGVCDCADGYTYVGGRCRLLNGLNSSCETDIDCLFSYDRESVICSDNVCKCADGYYHRTGNICRRKSMKIGDACVVHTDCEDLGTNVQCNNLICAEASQSDSGSSKTVLNARTYTPTSTGANTNAGTTSTNTHTKTDVGNEKSPSSDGTSQLSKSTSTNSTSKDTLALVNGRSDLTDDTENEAEHEEGGESEQKRKSREIAVQTSIDAFELKPLATPLVKNVGTGTTSSSSSRRFSRYRRRQPAFRYDYEDKSFSTLSNTDDDTEDKQYGSSCTENGKVCAGLPHSICSRNICFCRTGYYPSNGKCFAELGEIAESANECEHTFDTSTKKCICQTNYFYESNLRSCRKPILYTLSCTSDSQCSPFGSAYCPTQIPRRCTCEEYAEYDELNQMCVYKRGLGEYCETNDVCSTVTNAVCTNNLCACKENYLANNNTCVPGIGATCTEDVECGVDNSACDLTSPTSEETGRTCQCKKGYVHFKDECLKEAEELEDECIETEQCTPLLATCIDKKCSCTSEQHFKLGVCQEKKALDDSCTRSTQCFVEKEPENVECRNSVCQCKFGYQADEEQKTCIRVVSSTKNSSGRPSALKIITFLLIGSAFLITSAAIKQAYYD